MKKTHHFFQNNYIFEFGEHNKIASATALFIEKACNNYPSKLFLRSDCKRIDFSSYLNRKKICFSSKYLMFATLLLCILFNRNVFITTLPEGASNLVCKTFQNFLLFLLFFYKKEIGLVVRDLKKSKAKRFTKLLKNKKVQIFAESSSLAENYKKILNRKVDYLYTNFCFPRKTKSKKKYITFLGSIDKKRRNYETAKKIISKLPNEKFLFLGHISRLESKKLFVSKFGIFKNIIAKTYFTNREFDNFLSATKVFININKPKFYQDKKGSGYLGDAFFGRSKCFVPQSLFKKHENKILIPYHSASDVILKICKTKTSFKIDKNYLQHNQQLFVNNIKKLFNNVR